MTPLSRALLHCGDPSWSLQDGREMYDACLEEIGAEVVNSVGMRLVLIPPGRFLMGSPETEEGRGDDETQHEVEITRPIYLGIYPVTQAEFEGVMGYNPSYFCARARGEEGVWYQYHKPGGGAEAVAGLDTLSFPVENVSWEEAAAVCERLTERDPETYGLTYRLPTEAEWEWACREAGAKGGPFHFGDSLTSRLANFNGEGSYGTDAKGPFLGRTAKVGSYPPNALGLFDLHGNVREWCADGYEAFPGQRVKDPVGPTTGAEKVFRGGSWCDRGLHCRSASRNHNTVDNRINEVGFRVALGAAVPPAE